MSADVGRGEREPLVSIVVPVFNGERYLRESLDSILGQTYRNTEVVVMDDASTDGAPGILAEYGERDRRVTVHRQAVNQGIFANINAGLALAKGDLIAIHHSDDLYHPELLVRQVDYLSRNRPVGAVFSLDTFIDETGREFGRVRLPADIRAGTALDFGTVLNGVLRHENVFIRGGSSLVRRTVYNEVGTFDPTYGIRADLELWLRIARRRSLAILDEYLVKYRYGHENSSARYLRLRTEPELWFSVVDRILEDGGRALAEPDALAAYEGHRAEDLLKVTVNRYVADSPRSARKSLELVRPRRLLGTRRVQRGRLLTLWAALQVLVRLPRLDSVARIFRRRWYGAGAA
jgi:glycosyltransferase involved in cell wall biosynthesis